MKSPESRRFGIPKSDSSGAGTRPRIKLSTPAPPAPTGKTTRAIPRTRRARREDGTDEAQAEISAAKEETRAKNQLVLVASLGGGGFFLLLVIIAIAMSSGSSAPARDATRRPPPKAAAAPEPPPPPPRRAHNYVRNTGAIVFVCAGTEKHQDQEVVLSACPKCPSRNAFAWDEEASGYRCSSCKGIYENSAIRCGSCGRNPRVTHLKKTVSAQ